MRIGLLGTGPWAQLAHAPALGAHPGVEFVGVWGRRPQAAAALAEAHAVKAYDDVDALLGDVDAVAVALPPQVQAGLAARAAAAGCHLLLDKPLAMAPAAAREVVTAVERAGVASAVFFTTRFGIEPAAWIAEQSAAGGWYTAHATWLGSVFTGESPFATPWRREKGGLWDVGPHALSVLIPILGSVAEVTATRGAKDLVHLVSRHSGGASSTVTLSLFAPPDAAGLSVELRGAHGVTVLPDPSDGSVQALGRTVDALLESASTGQAHPCGVRFGLEVVEVLAAAERSAVEARPVLLGQGT